MDSKLGLAEAVLTTCRTECGHPGSGRVVPEAEVADDAHGPREQVKPPPAAGAVHDVTLLCPSQNVITSHWAPRERQAAEVRVHTG